MWNLINKRKSKQNTTRDIEIKNKLTVTRGEWEEDNGGKRKGRVKSRNMYKRLKDKANCSGGGLNVEGRGQGRGE